MTTEQFNLVATLLRNQHQAGAKALRLDAGSNTVVYLIDENHSSRELINDNIKIARTLIQHGAVSLIGIEGIEGDHISRRDLMSPDPERCFGNSTFAVAFIADTRVEVVGIDSRKLFKKIEEDVQAGKHTAATHPLEERRSADILQSLIKKLCDRPQVVASILNAGARHNDDIEKISEVDQIQGSSVVNISLIRIRSKLFPTT